MFDLLRSTKRVLPTHQRTLYIALAVLLSLWFASNALKHITNAPLKYDASQNVKIAYRLVHTGSYTLSKSGEARKDMRREPVPVLVISAFLLLHPSFEHYKSRDLEKGDLTRTVKLVNVFWEFLAALFIFLLCLELFHKPLVAAVGGVFTLAISAMTFLSTKQVIDTLYTELPASALLLVASWCAVRFVGNQTSGWAISLGVALGLLALTKAVFLSIGIGFILLMAFVERRELIFGSGTLAPWQVRRLYALLVLAFLATLTPWIVRNAISYGRPEMIAGRGEGILGLRMMLAELPSLGLLYASSPPPLMDRLGPVLGYTPADVQLGGKLGIILSHPEGQWRSFENKKNAEGYDGTTEQWLRHKAVLSAINHPLVYLTSIGLFAYRGMWFMQPCGLAAQVDPLGFYGLSALFLLCLLGLFFGGLISGHKVLTATFGLAVLAFILYSALSYGLPRFNAPLTPFVILAVFWTLHSLWRSLKEHVLPMSEEPTPDDPLAP